MALAAPALRVAVARAGAALWAAALGLVPVPGVADDPRLPANASADQIEACVQDNLPNRSSKLEITFLSTDRVGGDSRTRATIFWKRFGEASKLMMRFLLGYGLVHLTMVHGLPPRS